MVQDEKRQIGIVCSHCHVYNELRCPVCTNCGVSLALRPKPALPAPALARPILTISNPNAKKESAAENSMQPARHFVCSSCSSAVPSGHKFCGRCGTPVPDAVRDMITSYYGDMQNPNKAKLILIRGDGMDGLSFYLKAEQHIVGRKGQLVFDDPFISTKHANFFYRDGSLVVRDEGSLNGVYIRIRGSVALKSGDCFIAGDHIFRAELTSAVDDDGAGEDGTTFYGSPNQQSAYKVSQIFRGGLTGLAVCADSNSLLIGRDGADLNFPDDVHLSVEQCRVEPVSKDQRSDKTGDFTLTDLDSHNGTYVRIDNEQMLVHGDYLFIGRKLLRVEMNSN